MHKWNSLKSFLFLVLLATGISCASRDLEVQAEKPPQPSFLMFQDADGVHFTFDETLSDEGKAVGAIWSGRMTLTGIDPDMLWFSDRPNRIAFKKSTRNFVRNFTTTFTDANGGAPNAVVSWDDKKTDTVQFVVLELSNPQLEGDVLEYSVVGLPLDDPKTLQPLPLEKQFVPPATPNVLGKVTIFIDNAPPPGNTPVFIAISGGGFHSHTAMAG